MPRFALVTATLAAALGLCGCIGAGGPVSRIVDGRRVEGRYVAEDAYAAYVKAVTLEAKGDLRGADAAYEEAVRSDPESAHLWTRIGAIRCSSAFGTSAMSPWDAFTRATEIDPEFEQTWTERARCHMQKGDSASAERAARMAIALDPEESEPVLLLVSLYERAHDLEHARLWLDGLVLREPGNREAARAMLAFAERTGDEPRRRAATLLLQGAEPSNADAARPRGHDDATHALSEIDHALLRSDLVAARRVAVSHHVSSGMVALRAAALGQGSLAHAQAELVLLADPGDTDARIAAAVAADLARDDAAMNRALSAVPAAATDASPLGIALFAELLSRRAGAPAAAAWQAAAGSVTANGDALVARVAARGHAH